MLLVVMYLLVPIKLISLSLSMSYINCFVKLQHIKKKNNKKKQNGGNMYNHRNSMQYTPNAH